MLNIFALAACICYLHADVHKCNILVIIHFDIIMSKLLLDADFASNY